MKLAAAAVASVVLAASGPAGRAVLVVGEGLRDPFGVEFDGAGNTYIVEMSHRVSVLDKEGRLAVLAGTGEKGLSGDGGPAAKALFNGPHHLLFGPDGDLYVADTFNNCVRKIDLETGIVTRVAGTGVKGYGGDGGRAPEAQFGGVYNIAFRGNVLYATDLDNRRIRAIDLASGVVTTVAGSGDKGVPKDGEDTRSQPLVDPRAIAFDGTGNLYICERGGHALRVVDPAGKIRTVAGTGEAGFSGDGGPAREARLNGPKHIFVEKDGSVLITDTENHAIRRFTPWDGRIERVAGTGTAGTAGVGGAAEALQLNRPHGAQVHPRTGAIYISDSDNHRVVRIEPTPAASIETAPPRRVESPSRELAFVLTIDGTGSLTYTVERGAAGARTTALQPSPLGLRLRDRDFDGGLRFVSAGPVEALDETYTVPHGKRRAIRHRARQQAFTFQNGAGARLELIVRAADDGVAFRYRLPGAGGPGGVKHPPDKERRRIHSGAAKDQILRTLVDESTGFHVPASATAWMMPHQPPGKYTPAYEDYFKEVAAGTNAPTASGWSFPALFRIDGGRHWLLISEAGVDETNCGTRLAANAEGGRYRIRLPEAGEGLGVGAAEPTSKSPWTLPWRVLIVGGSLASVVESTLVEDVSPPSVVRDTSWIRPGRASWSWWSASKSPKDEAALKSFIDLASEMGWEYSLVDANWNEMPEGTIQRLVAYGRDKGVGILLWYNSGGPHNDVTEAPRDRMHIRDVRRAEFARLRDWGVKGVKVDFWHSDKQDRIAQYLDILRDAADYRILVNFHGCTLPRGWSRTYPHLMTMEGVMGAEQYKFKANYPQTAPAHDTLLAFTRNVVGPMDYTPVTFTDHKYPRLTTDAHELAQAVVFESGIQHYADSVAAYRALPAAARDFLKAVPAAWDETRLLAGDPGRRAVFARRAGRAWFVGGINGEEAAQRLDLDLSFLGDGAFTLSLISDGKEARSLTHASRRVSGKDRLAVELLPRGGFAAHITPGR